MQKLGSFFVPFVFTAKPNNGNVFYAKIQQELGEIWNVMSDKVESNKVEYLEKESYKDSTKAVILSF